MKLLRILFPNKPWMFKKQVTDEQFGLMWFNKDRNPKFNHYQAHFSFKPTNFEIDAFFTSDHEGIDPKQRHFYWEIVRKYNDLLPMIGESVENFYRRNHKEDFRIQNFTEEYKLFAISISRYAYQKQEWSLSFTPTNDPITGITINFRNWEILDIIG